MDKPNHIHQLTFLRFVAAALIVVFHFGKNTYPFNCSGIKDIISEGSIAVSFFFFLSGLVLYISYLRLENLTLKSFIIKRIARIYPVYLFAFLITLFSAMLIINSFPKGLNIILQILCLHAWKPGACLEINFPAWSISVEFFFYLLFPALLVFFKKLQLKQILIFVLLIWGISFLQHFCFETYLYKPNDPIIDEFILYFPLWHLNAFLFGMFAGLSIIYLKEKTNNLPTLPLISFLVGTTILIIILGSENLIKPHVHNGLLSPLYFIITVGLALDNTLFSKIMSNSKLVYLGEISYGLYILQYPIYLLFTWIFHLENTNGMYFYTYFISLLIISSFSFRFIENKFKLLIIKKYG